MVFVNYLKRFGDSCTWSLAESVQLLYCALLLSVNPLDDGGKKIENPSSSLSQAAWFLVKRKNGKKKK